MTEHPLTEPEVVPGDPTDPASAALADRLAELHPGAEHQQRHEQVVITTMTEGVDGLSGVRQRRVPMVSGSAKITSTDDTDEQEGTWRD